MKYFNGMTFLKGKQIQAFVCAKTKKRALEIINENNHIMGYKYFTDYWSSCGNDEMKQIANDNEGLWLRGIAGYFKQDVLSENDGVNNG